MIRRMLVWVSLCVLAVSVPGAALQLVAGRRPAAAAPATIAFVQTKTEYQSGFSSDTLAFTTNITAGNTIILTIGIDNSDNTVTGVSDNLGNTYQLAVNREAEANRAVYIYYARPTAAGATTITVTYSLASSASLVAAEFSGITALDTTIAGTLGTTNPINPGTITPVASNTVVITAGVNVNNAVSYTAGTGLTVLTVTATTSRLCSQYEIVSGGAGVAQNTDCTMGTVRNWSAIAATFKP